jgi:hypothetical protein
MLSTAAPAQVAQSVEQWTEKAFQSALPLTPTEVARFWSHVDRSGGPDACHHWTKGLDKDGYGLWSPTGGKTVRAHRLALTLKLGRPLVKGEEARHLPPCAMRSCCNPLHLGPGTHQQNIADREAAGTTQKGAKHWKTTLTEANVIEIRRRAPTEPYASIAADFGVGKEAIRKIVLGENWKHIAGALARGEVTLRKARALFGVTSLVGGAR